MPDIEQLISRIQNFSDERDWDQFHSPKNISMALAVEASELLEHFQWISQDESRNLDSQKLADVADEAADVFLYLLRLCDEMGINLVQVAHKKIDKNAIKYPVEKSRGRSAKYDEL